MTGARCVMERDLTSVNEVEDFLWRSLLTGDFRRWGPASDGEIGPVTPVAPVAALGLSETAEENDMLEDDVDSSDGTEVIGTNVAVVRDFAPNSSPRSSSRFKDCIV